MDILNPKQVDEILCVNAAVRVIEAFLLRQEPELSSALLRLKWYRDTIPYLETTLSTGFNARVAAWIQPECPVVRMIKTNTPIWKEARVEAVWSVHFSTLLKFVHQQLCGAAVRERMPYPAFAETTFPDPFLEERMLVMLTKGI